MEKGSLHRNVAVKKPSKILDNLIIIKRALRVEPQDVYLWQALEVTLRSKATIYDALLISPCKRSWLRQIHVKEKRLPSST